ncbi:secretory carrier-associated membrane protein [Elysia marginata]|uniref:Secretory carrier-associated membrane protein n=1 Tax=Elysia marginata TaxID=1093978 RepID=A0AAV4IY17_9GAST|nr:secretory carrier-associated membrane protein [Elysia marginata]
MPEHYFKTSSLTQRCGRPAWRGEVTKGAKTYEQQRLQAAKTKRAAHKARVHCNPTPQATAAPWTCPHCNTSDFRARMGLISHLQY